MLSVCSGANVGTGVGLLALAVAVVVNVFACRFRRMFVCVSHVRGMSFRPSAAQYRVHTWCGHSVVILSYVTSVFLTAPVAVVSVVVVSVDPPVVFSCVARCVMVVVVSSVGHGDP